MLLFTLMSMFKINFKAIHTELVVEHKNLLTKKFKGLEKFIGSESDINCDVEFEKVANHPTGRVYRVEANLYLSGRLYRSEATEENFAKAISRVKSGLEKKLRRASGKQTSLVRSGKRKIKNLLRFGSGSDV